MRSTPTRSTQSSRISKRRATSRRSSRPAPSSDRHPRPPVWLTGSWLAACLPPSARGRSRSCARVGGGLPASRRAPLHLAAGRASCGTSSRWPRAVLPRSRQAGRTRCCCSAGARPPWLRRTSLSPGPT
ncbi:hypothetical protein T492DRAFT_1067689 [Pavlovales sp. CCMP2436]|nr:hypothetical protein T492DRAFT_1067689 [Pavlovales sp. CCMP2436]